MKPQDMTDEECNRRICEWRGWAIIPYSWANDYGEVVHGWKITDSKGFASVGAWASQEYAWKEGGLPNYTTDLNAMHEAEKRLSEEQRELYWLALSLITDGLLGGDPWRIVHTTAQQRARAMCRVIQTTENNPQP